MIQLLKIATILTCSLIISMKTHAALPIKTKATAQLKEELKPTYKKWLKQANLGDHQISFSLINLKNLTTQDSFNQSNPFIPASLTKVFTSYYALSHLGAFHQFKTYLYTDGPVKDGVLKGNLYLYGEADPLLTHAKLFNFVMALKAKGITKVDGKFIFDDSFIPSIDMISIIGLGDQTYNPAVSALSSEFNRFALWNSPKEKGQYTPIPSLESLNIETTSEKFDPGRKFKHVNESVPNINIKTNPNSETWLISSKQKYRRRHELPVRNPALFTASSLRFMAKKMGITLPFPEAGTVPRGRKEIACCQVPC